MQIVEHIFKAYDIRGLASTELSEELAYSLGRAFVVFLRNHNLLRADQVLVVGKDMRPTSGPFQQAVIQGIEDEGIGVVDVGQVSTPLFNFACANYDQHAGGIMVTASHNPAKYNGFKLTLGNGLPIGEAFGMAEIKELVKQSQYVFSARNVKAEQKNVREDYLQKIFSIVPKEAVRPMKLVVDAGNGMAQVTFPEMLAQLPVQVEYLYLEPDGNFPNHEANPLKVETLVDLQKKVVEVGADFGFALDGDADRVGLVDEKGEVVGASFVGALLGLEVLRNHPNAKMLYDVRSSMIVPELWKAAGATAEMCKVGHANIKKMLKETGGAYASELSLHLYYKDTFDVESTDLSLLYVLQMLSRENKPLSEIVAPLKKYFHSGEINFEIEDKAVAVARVEDMYKNNAVEISHLDGLWMKFDWGWLSVRLSNTEPVVRLNLEATTEEDMKQKVAEVKKVIEG